MNPETYNLWRLLGHYPERGFETVKLSWEKGCRPDEIVAMPEFQEVRELHVHGWGPPGRSSDYRKWFDAFASRPTQLRTLRLDSYGGERALGDSCGDLSALLDGQPQLEDVDICGASSVPRPFSAASLKRLRVEGKIEVEPNFVNVLSSKFPQLVELVLFTSKDELAPGRVVAFMGRGDLPALRAVKFPTLAPGPELFADVARAPLLRSLEQLSLVHAEQPDDDPYIASLGQHLDAFAHLQSFMISKDFCDQSLTDRHPRLGGVLA